MLFGSHMYTAVPLGDFAAPALPSLSPLVFQTAFVHSSKNLQSVPRSKFSYTEDFADNERLEWVGDALLYSIVARYLYRTYPRLRVSYLSAIRQRLVMNTTLAMFATKYGMHEALQLHPSFDKLRDDVKTRADTFEAFVGAVAQVHGVDVLQSWIEELVKPYAKQLHDYHANTHGQAPEPEVVTAQDEAETAQTMQKTRRYRFCGFLPLPFLSRPVVKSILPPNASSNGQANYGTIAAPARNGYSRIEESSSGASRPSSSKPSGFAQATTTSSFSKDATLPSKLIPARVSDNKHLQKHQISPPKLSDGAGIGNIQDSSSNQKAANGKKLTNGNASQDEAAPKKKLGVNGWQPVTAQNGASAPAGHAGLAGSPALPTTSTNNNVPQKTASDAEYIAALQAVRSDPITYIEGQSYFDKKHKRYLSYDEEGSTPKKAVARLKVNGVVISQGVATSTDKKLAKARAAFKAIEHLKLLPEPPTANGTLNEPPKAALGWESDDGATSGDQKPDQGWAAIESNGKLRSTSNQQTVANGLGKNGVIAPNGTPFLQPIQLFPSNPTQLRKHAEMQVDKPGPFPPSFYASLPNAGKESERTKYYVLSVKGFSGGVYCGVLNSQMQLVGQATSSKKSDAIQEAETASSRNVVQTIVSWKFTDRSSTSQGIGKVNLLKNPKESTGTIPSLTHALAVAEKDPARLVWLEWFSEDKSIWKCVVLADAIFVASGKNATRKLATVDASVKAMEELERHR